MFIGKFQDKGLFSTANILQIADVFRGVVFMFLANSSHIFSRETSECSAILYSLPKQLNLVARSSRLTVQFSDHYAAQLTSFFRYRKIPPNLVDCSWL